jgi:hypothetical protein
VRFCQGNVTVLIEHSHANVCAESEKVT